MRFRTEINLDKNSIKIVHSEKVCTIGSCFAENIAGYFSQYRFNILENPFGVLYNPVSIFNSLKLLRDKKKFTKDDLFNYQSEWHSFYHHSDFSHHEPDVCLKNINEGIISAREFLAQTDLLIITYGTSFVYKHAEKNIVVSNCHKIPAAQFDRIRLTLAETKNIISETIQLLKRINTDLKIIFTVSPVRHWKDGAEENQLSKSTLLLGVNEAVSQTDDAIYFPSYEIMMDDLRDYRFYEADLVHPNKLATDYIWEKFSSALLSEKCKNAMKEVAQIDSARKHRPRNIYSDSHQKFVQDQIELINNLEKKYPYLNLSQDKEFFMSQKSDITH